MQGDDVEKLEEDVNSYISRILQEPGSRKYRCHEVATLLQDELEEGGWDACLMHGQASYDINFLAERWLEEYKEGAENLERFQGLQEIVKSKTPQEGRYTFHLHSWVETDGSVADYLPSVSFGDLQFTDLPIVGEKESLRGDANYYPMGRDFDIFGNKYVCTMTSFEIKIPKIGWITATLPIPRFTKVRV